MVRIRPTFRVDLPSQFDPAARVFLLLVACGWLFLYFDSVHQRRKAGALIAELKIFTFPEAGFREVRDLAIRNGGAAIQRDSLPRLPDFGTPLPPESPPGLHRNVSFHRPWLSCTEQNCTFEVRIETRLSRVPLQGRIADLFYATLPYLGIRSWILYSRFEVQGGKLERSSTTIAEFRIGRLGSYRGLLPFGYEITTTNDPVYFDHDQNYTVGLDHSIKLPSNVLHTRVLQTVSAPTKRAFDIDVRCLNGLFRGCGFDELAPSAWADYLANDDGTGNRSPRR